MSSTRTMIAPGRSRLSGNVALSVGGALLLLLVLGAIFAPVLTTMGPLDSDYGRISELPSAAHPFGTDYLGRDTLSRILFGGRATLVITLFTVVGSAVIGVPLGLLSGYVGGAVDMLLMRTVDGFLAIPGLVLALSIAFLLGPTVTTLSLALIIARAPYFARIARSETMLLTGRAFIQLSVVAGCSRSRIWFRHLLPNMSVMILVQAAMTAGTAILLIAGLSFLGLGLPAPHPSWGGMLREGAPFLEHAPLQSLIPGVFIFLSILSFNLLADGIQKAFAS